MSGMSAWHIRCRGCLKTVCWLRPPGVHVRRSSTELKLSQTASITTVECSRRSDLSSRCSQMTANARAGGGGGGQKRHGNVMGVGPKVAVRAWDERSGFLGRTQGAAAYACSPLPLRAGLLRAHRMHQAQVQPREHTPAQRGWGREKGRMLHLGNDEERARTLINWFD